jgi:hypothetical protein
MSSLQTSSLLHTMKFLTSLTAVSLAVVLTACGGTDPDTETSFQATGVMTVQVAGNVGNSAGNGAAQPAQATEPQPDCAPEGCNGLRIIDANAEAYRMDAMKRAEQEAQQAGA